MQLVFFSVNVTILVRALMLLMLQHGSLGSCCADSGAVSPIARTVEQDATTSATMNLDLMNVSFRN